MLGATNVRYFHDTQPERIEAAERQFSGMLNEALEKDKALGEAYRDELAGIDKRLGPGEARMALYADASRRAEDKRRELAEETHKKLLEPGERLLKLALEAVEARHDHFSPRRYLARSLQGPGGEDLEPAEADLRRAALSTRLRGASERELDGYLAQAVADADLILGDAVYQERDRQGLGVAEVVKRLELGTQDQKARLCTQMVARVAETFCAWRVWASGDALSENSVVGQDGFRQRLLAVHEDTLERAEQDTARLRSWFESLRIRTLRRTSPDPGRALTPTEFMEAGLAKPNGPTEPEADAAAEGVA